MPHQGRIAEWNDERGFGFITPLDGGQRVFAHISEFPKQLRRPEPLDLVSYELGADERGRPRASKVSFLAPTAPRYKDAPAGSVSSGTWAAIGVLAVIVLGTALLARSYALWLPVVYLVMSGITYIAYGMDKYAAQRGAYRTQESALHLLALLGGWPGALAAQQRFHHKTRKQPFRTIFLATVALNCAMLALALVMIAISPG